MLFFLLLLGHPLDHLYCEIDWLFLYFKIIIFFNTELKKSILVVPVVDTHDVSRDSPNSLRLIGLRKGGATTTDPDARNFTLVASQIRN